jgi:hypothetical protein
VSFQCELIQNQWGAQNMPFGSSFGYVVSGVGENGELPLAGQEGGVWASWILTHGRFFNQICSL